MVNGSFPYLADLISKHVSFCYLQSSEVNLFLVCCTYSNFGDCRISVCRPLPWNNLLTDIKYAETSSQFKTLLKTFFTSKLSKPNVADGVACY